MPSRNGSTRYSPAFRPYVELGATDTVRVTAAPATTVSPVNRRDSISREWQAVAPNRRIRSCDLTASVSAVVSAEASPISCRHACHRSLHHELCMSRRTRALATGGPRTLSFVPESGLCHRHFSSWPAKCMEWLRSWIVTCRDHMLAHGRLFVQYLPVGFPE